MFPKTLVFHFNLKKTKENTTSYQFLLLIILHFTDWFTVQIIESPDYTIAAVLTVSLKWY